jgi:hypothetical protein
MVVDETLGFRQLSVQGNLCKLLQDLLKSEAPEPGSTEVVLSLDIHGTLRVVWSKILNPKAGEFQSNEMPKCQPENSEIWHSEEYEYIDARTFEA